MKHLLKLEGKSAAFSQASHLSGESVTRRGLSFLCLLLTVFPLQASEGWYSQSEKKGFYWYEEPKEDLPSKGPEGEPPIPLAPSLKDYSYQEIWQMHPDQFKPLLEDFRKNAVWKPTMTSVSEYFVMQDIARRKARVFMDVSTLAKQLQPSLSLEKDVFNTSSGRQAQRGAAEQEIHQLIGSSDHRFGMLFFTSQTCSYCPVQDQVLHQFQNQFPHFEVLRVDVDQSPHLAKKFAIQTTPSLLLIERGSQKTLPLTQGVISLSRLKKYLYRTIRYLKGESKEGQFLLLEHQQGGGFDPQMPEGLKTYFKEEEE